MKRANPMQNKDRFNCPADQRVYMTDIVRDPDHSDGAPTVEGTGIRVWNIASAYEHSGYSPARSWTCIRR